MTKLPAHIKGATRKWAEGILSTFELESHHVRLLVLACEAWDRGEAARVALAENGRVFLDRYGQPRARPEVQIERDSPIMFCRILRELRLDVAAPDDSRPPGLTGGARRAS